MVRKMIVHACTVLALLFILGVTASSQASPAKAGQTCGGIAGLQCPAGEACRYPTNKCNVADLSGTCVKVKDPCPTGGAKVCGCDGKTYDNECLLLTAGVREASKGACPAAK